MISIISHAECTDGIVSAYLIWKWCRINNLENEVLFCYYGKEPPEVKYDKIIMVDFSYKREIIEGWCDAGKKVVMLDHHESTAKLYGGYTTLTCALHQGEGLFTRQILLDNSGAGLAFMSVNKRTHGFGIPGANTVNLEESLGLQSLNLQWDLDKWFTIHRKQSNFSRLKNIVKHTEDRDLWKFELPDTNVYYELLNSFEKSVENIDKIVNMSDVEWANHYSMAFAKVDLREKLSKDYAGKARLISFAGYHGIPIVNCPADFASRVCEVLYQDKPFSIAFSISPEQVYISLRSKKNYGVDVSLIAEKFGGGGHVNSAGMKLELEQVVDFLKGKL